ncbi:hypothetical protein [Clostridium sp. E02]|nr:hypothetical protein [Clostridium sp. E02]
MNKIKRYAMKLSAFLPLIMVSIIANFACYGPAHSPDLPPNNKYMRKF